MLVLKPVSENALMLYLADTASPATAARVKVAVARIEQCLGSELIDLIPSYASVLILFDPLASTHVALAGRLRKELQEALAEPLSESPEETESSGSTLVLPVYYATEAGEDLEAVAARAGLSIQQVIDLHSAVEYRVYAIGFAPGFAYLGELDPRIATPRHSTPRMHVPKGAVAIADRQTAVYPAASPGGWNLIGRCPITMFDPSANPCMPIATGDSVRFEAISREEFLSLGGELS